MGIRHVHLQCSCHHPDHVTRVSLETNAGERPEFWIQPMLNPARSLFRRIWIAVKYILGWHISDKYWGGYQFDSVLVDDESMHRLTTLIAHRNLILKLQAAKRKREARELRKVPEDV